ncbi:LuxR C-terminal-related transcriptional regulator [Streptomyces sp. NPDC006487]|uniref:LuxR C-terminal-related transcriptional regulator n=1 Tax=Streptomyces sp. NPDC006487 TaxID=3364748 RepID=UPI00367E3640
MEHLHWPTAKVRVALDECVRLTLIRPSWETPGRLRAVSPDLGLQSLLAQHEAALLSRQRQMADTRVEVARLIEEFTVSRQQRRHSEVERLEGIDRIRDRIEELSMSCRKSLDAFAPGGGQSQASRTASRPLSASLNERGVVMRTVYLDSIYNDPPSVDHLRWLVQQGNGVRTVASLPSRMIIFDGEVVMLPMDPEDSAAGALLFQGPGILTTLGELFTLVWEKATPVSSGRRQRASGDSEELTSQEKAVLRLLGEGLTDEVVARKLGVSVRTGRRITAELMGRLGAKSRFQAGLRAAKLGWLDEDSPDGEADRDPADPADRADRADPSTAPDSARDPAREGVGGGTRGTGAARALLV